jgi:hypothetical protein
VLVGHSEQKRDGTMKKKERGPESWVQRATKDVHYTIIHIVVPNETRGGRDAWVCTMSQGSVR